MHIQNRGSEPGEGDRVHYTGHWELCLGTERITRAYGGRLCRINEVRYPWFPQEDVVGLFA